MTEPRGKSTVMTDKQLAAMARYGRRVEFKLPDLGEEYFGYVIGFDDQNVRIAKVEDDGSVKVLLRHREYIAGMDADENSNKFRLEDPDVAAELEFMIKPFRTFVMNQYFPGAIAS